MFFVLYSREVITISKMLTKHKHTHTHTRNHDGDGGWGIQIKTLCSKGKKDTCVK